MYTEEVKFSKTGTYGCSSYDEDDVYTIEEFEAHCRCGAFIDYDGFGYPVKAKKANNTIVIQPSNLHDIPEDATHIVWYNR